MVDYLQKGQTLNGTQQCIFSYIGSKEILNSITFENSVKASCSTWTVPQFHKSVIAIALINDNVFELIEHLPYSPYLPPSHFHLFTKLKKNISGYHSQSDDE